MKKEYINCIKKLEIFKHNLIQNDDIKKGKLYFTWISNKTDKILSENDSQYIYKNLINNTLSNYNITKYIYNTSNNIIKNIIDNNYELDNKSYKFINKKISVEDTLLLAKYILFKRGNVVWVDFGFNIGREFGGIHPAIILKNLNSELFVLPVSSKIPSEYKKIEEKYTDFEKYNKEKQHINEIFEINKIFGFKNMVRWANITRIKKISILRLNFAGSIGAISGNDLDIISQKIRNEF